MAQFYYDSVANDLEVSESQIKATQAALEAVQSNNALLLENLGDVQMMLDNKGWMPMFDYTTNGLTKNQLNIAAQQLRELVVGNPTIKKGNQLRHGYVFGKGFSVDLSTVKTLTAKTKIQSYCDKYYSPERLEQWTKADYTDGNFVMIGDDKTKKLSFFPIEQITGVYVDGDDREDVIAFQRSWMKLQGEKLERVTSWYYLDTFEGKRASKLVNAGGPNEVDTTKTIFWNPVNRQIGWTWGIPDALAAIAWSRIWRDFLDNGQQVSSAMTKVIFALTSKTRAGGTAASAQIAASQSAAQTAALPSTMGISALSTAGKGYDFASGEPIAAMIASAIEVSLEDLLSKPDTDKADGIPAHVKRAMRVRQQVNASLIKRTLVWMGAPATISIEWPEIDDMDVYRKAEMLTGAWGTGLFGPVEMRNPIADNAGIVQIDAAAPTGVLIPNNLATVKAGAQVTNTSGDSADKTTNQSGSDQKMDGSNSQQNGQGRDSQKTGQHSAGSNDLRDGTTKK